MAETLPPTQSLPLLIIVTGSPGTGKTTLSQQLAAELDLVLIHRDSLKELLFDSLGWSDRAWSKQLGIASYRLLYYLIATCLRLGGSFIVESNFNTDYDTSQLLDLQHRYPYYPCQVICRADASVVMKRLHQRVNSGERHRGHGDQFELANLELTHLQTVSASLAIGGSIIDVDTTDVTGIDIANLVAQVRRLLPQPEAQ